MSLANTAIADSKIHAQGYSQQDAEDPPPDGGYGWVCAICSMFLLFSTWGANSSYGVVLEYYIKSHYYANEATQYDYALIVSMVGFLGQFLAPVALICTEMFGIRKTIFFGVLVQTLGYILASFCNHIWQLYICQGLLLGIAFAFIFIPPTMTLSSWFLHKRGMATGISSAGAGLGGIVFSLSIDSIIKASGDHKWALRYLGLSTCVISVICALLIRFRKPKDIPKFTFNELNQKTIKMFNWKKINLPTVYIALWFSTIIIGYTLLLFTLSSYATSIGLTSSQGSILTAILNASQTVGRPCMGLLADFLGRINTCLLLTISNSLMIFAFWTNASNFTSLIIFSLIIGLTIGIGSALSPALCTDNVEADLQNSSYSFINILVGINSLFPAVVALKLKDPDLSNPFFNTQIFCGCTFAVGAIFLIIFREWKLRKIITIRYDSLLNNNCNKNEKNNSSKKILLVTDQEELGKCERILKQNLVCYIVRIFHPLKT
ncbi:MCT family MFS transporter [Ascoidea rubescens DSM 1968]|uniref:MFS general substrate transporter n=1 Tax=Ascoidea rubescens DSM 1968 TaxID=1344418 RepID=A0A1D2VCP9_9ASCO|nr:MFS general substrate transporter [Ascoidea rubescens DSM 1968]ODV59290.1 MFS general substrate transporter [Ascoidea rubescens DSM 1968]